MGAIVRYSIERLLILLVALVLLHLAGARGWLLIILAAIVSSAVSYLVMRRRTELITDSLEEWDNRRRAKRGADEEYEDSVIDRETKRAEGDANPS